MFYNWNDANSQTIHLNWGRVGGILLQGTLYGYMVFTMTVLAIFIKKNMYAILPSILDQHICIGTHEQKSTLPDF